MSLIAGRWQIESLVAYQGNKDCMDPRCSHRYVNGKMMRGCMGYHCPRCHEPCKMTGHDCPDTLRDANG